MSHKGAVCVQDFHEVCSVTKVSDLHNLSLLCMSKSSAAASGPKAFDILKTHGTYGTHKLNENQCTRHDRHDVDSLSQGSSSQENFFRKELLKKTRMCNDPNNCKWGENCRYAHCEDELRTLEENAEDIQWTNYRTKLCRHFLNGKCKFGSKCAFLHVHRLKVFQDILPNEKLI